MFTLFADFQWNDWLGLLLAIPVAALGVGRLSRAIYYDAFPPSAWFRAKWDLLTEKSDWNLLMHCPWCITHWIAAFCIGWFFLGWVWFPVAVAWWIFFGWFAISYIASMIIVRDEPEE